MSSSGLNDDTPTRPCHVQPMASVIEINFASVPRSEHKNDAGSNADDTVSKAYITTRMRESI